MLQARSIIEFAVQTEIRVCYTDLSKALKVFSGGNSLPAALFAIMEEDKRAGRALTCALVTTGTGLPHKGFFDRAKDLGFQFQDEREFWESQVRQLRRSEYPDETP